MKIQITKNLNFGKKYELSKETQQLLSKSTGMSIEQMRNEPLHKKPPNKILELNKVKKYIKLICLEYTFNETKNQIKELLFNKPINMFRKLGRG